MRFQALSLLISFLLHSSFAFHLHHLVRILEDLENPIVFQEVPISSWGEGEGLTVHLGQGGPFETLVRVEFKPLGGFLSRLVTNINGRGRRRRREEPSIKFIREDGRLKAEVTFPWSGPGKVLRVRADRDHWIRSQTEILGRDGEALVLKFQSTQSEENVVIRVEPGGESWQGPQSAIDTIVEHRRKLGEQQRKALIYDFHPLLTRSPFLRDHLSIFLSSLTA
ncbi:hypothetical protein IE53DRAFT_278992 [Violaceomyces palustris]|uniref:Uncharacterized protein n=1 Tax=Violaceomyces palustris TaxID=1673888 RepID=A0ACD0P2Z7_9BASI|nr:hypothetical protein IE53DRAFT_278992 [Violaceomyces palustris]